MEQANTSKSDYSRYGLLLALLVAASLGLYWTGNARTPLWDRDEPRFAQAAREMLETGDFIVPRFQGRLRPDKPVLGYWFFAAGMKVFGDGEFGARAASGIFGALSIIVLYRLARSMTGSDRAALTSAAILATAPVMFVESKLCTVDAALLFWLLVCFRALWHMVEGTAGRLEKICFWAALALAGLTKGPVALAAVFTPVLIMTALGRDRSFLKRMGWAWGVPLTLAITAPWLIAVQAKTGGEFLRSALPKHVIGRSLSAMEGHSGFPGFYVATLFGTFFPWAFFVPGAIWDACKGIRARKREVFLISWVVGLIIVLEFVSTKMVHYALPVFPALSILVALFLARRAVDDRLTKAGAGAAFVMALILAATPAAAAWKAGMVAAIYPLAGAGAILAVAMARALSRSRHGGFPAAAFAAMFGWLFIMGAWALPIVGSYGATPAILEAVSRAKEAAGADAAVASVGYEEPSLVFGLGGKVEFLSGPRDFLSDGVSAAPRILLLSSRREGLLGGLDKRVLVAADWVEGFNLTKGRREEICLFYDWGAPAADDVHDTGAIE